MWHFLDSWVLRPLRTFLNHLDQICHLMVEGNEGLEVKCLVQDHKVIVLKNLLESGFSHVVSSKTTCWVTVKGCCSYKDGIDAINNKTNCFKAYHLIYRKKHKYKKLNALLEIWDHSWSLMRKLPWWFSPIQATPMVVAPTQQETALSITGHWEQSHPPSRFKEIGKCQSPVPLSASHPTLTHTHTRMHAHITSWTVPLRNWLLNWYVLAFLGYVIVFPWRC